jgi:hypothetical protein
MEPQPNYRIKLSLSNLHTSEVALELIRKVMSRRKHESRTYFIDRMQEKLNERMLRDEELERMRK